MQPLPQLLCLPPAGAGPSLFHPWTLRHRDRIDVRPIPLPGRETRITEPLPASLEAMADQLAAQLAPALAPRYALFGYSMGAVLGYEMARRWAGAGLQTPEMIFILACNPPDRLAETREPLHTLESGAFWQAIMDLGGTPKELLDLPEALALFEPIVRNDFRICETYQHLAGGFRLGCPAHVFIADRDSMVDAETAALWQDFVAGDVVLHPLPGNHMLERRAFAALLDRLLTLWPAPLQGSTAASGAVRTIETSQ
jgi:surfactin synthase thioesterase subunit